MTRKMRTRPTDETQTGGTQSGVTEKGETQTGDGTRGRGGERRLSSWQAHGGIVMEMIKIGRLPVHTYCDGFFERSL